MIFDTKRNTLGFTLIELMVVIAIISLTTLGITRVDFNRISDEQRLDIFTNEIVSKLERVRNNALIGKGVGVNVETPDGWRVEISDTGSGSLQTSYDVGGSWTNNTEDSISLASRYSIGDLRCVRIDDTSEAITGTLTLTIDGNNFTLSGCSDDSFKILEMTQRYKGYQSTIKINTLSGLIEVD